MSSADPPRPGIPFLLGLALLLMQSITQAEAETTERIEWTKTPIRLALQVGHERLLHLPGSVEVGVPAALQPLLRTQSIDGTVYLLAQTPFDTTRIMLRERDGGQVYLLDVSATKQGGQTHPVQIYVKRAAANSADPSDPAIDTDPPRIGYVALTRFAAQQLYAPLRLVRGRPGIVRIPVARAPIALVRGAAIEALPWVAWRAGRLYLTAIKLTNLTEESLILDPRQLRGRWLAATFQHNRLLPAGDAADTSVVYLISARPVEAARQ